MTWVYIIHAWDMIIAIMDNEKKAYKAMARFKKMTIYKAFKNGMQVGKMPLYSRVSDAIKRRV